MEGIKHLFFVRFSFLLYQVNIILPGEDESSFRVVLLKTWKSKRRALELGFKFVHCKNSRRTQGLVEDIQFRDDKYNAFFFAVKALNDPFFPQSCSFERDNVSAWKRNYKGLRWFGANKHRY